MINAKIVRKNNDFLDYIKHLEQANHSVDIGVFAEQGQHPTAGMSYVELLMYHASPTDPFTPTRDVIGELGRLITQDQLKDPAIQKIIMQWATNPYSSANDEKMLQGIGEILRDEAKYGIFGNPSLLASNSARTIAQKGGRNEPLVDDGHLQRAFAFRTSLNNMIKEKS